MSHTNTTTDFKCNICGISIVSARANGIGVGEDGLIFKPPISAKLHICNLCLAGLARLYKEKKDE